MYKQTKYWCEIVMTMTRAWRDKYFLATVWILTYHIADIYSNVYVWHIKILVRNNYDTRNQKQHRDTAKLAWQANIPKTTFGIMWLTYNTHLSCNRKLIHDCTHGMFLPAKLHTDAHIKYKQLIWEKWKFLRFVDSRKSQTIVTLWHSWCTGPKQVTNRLLNDNCRQCSNSIRVNNWYLFTISIFIW